MHCITFAFSQCFMHFKCVFYMLKSYVLVRLDWAEPMNFFFFFFACHILMHFSCIRTIFFSLSLIFMCWYLSACLSLSQLVCSMAPKRKSSPPRNPLCSGASSFDSMPSLVQFRDDKAHKDFSENFSRRNIHSERQVILSDISDIDLPTVIYSRG